MADHPRWPLSRLLFRKNGLARSGLDHQTRSFLDSVLTERWIRVYDTPAPEDMDGLIATAADLPPCALLVEADERLLSDPDEVASALAGLVGLNAEIRLLLPRLLTAPEEERLAARFGREALLPLGTEHLPNLVVLLLAGAVPRAHGPRLLVDALRQAPKAALAYGDEADLRPGGVVTQHWFKPQRASPWLAGQGTLVGRLAALDLGQLENPTEVLAPLLSPMADRRALVSRLAARLPAGGAIAVPHICHFNTRPPDNPLPCASPELPDLLPSVSVIIPNRDNWALLSRCLDSLETTDWPADRLEIIVVDNGSTDVDCLDGLARAEASGQIRIIRYPGPFNYARINNVAVRQSIGEVLILLNNDTEALRSDWLKCLARYALQDGVGAVGPKLLYPDRTVQHAGVVLGMNGGAVHAFVGLAECEGGYQNLANLTREVGAVTAACLAIRRSTFDAVGGFNETFEVAFNDVVLCCDLVEAGFVNCYLAEALFLHHESKTRGHDTTEAKRRRQIDECRRAVALHPGLFAADPYYSPNLSLDVFFKPAAPPRSIPLWKAREGR